jgi:hypothetical protein
LIVVVDSGCDVALRRFDGEACLRCGAVVEHCGVSIEAVEALLVAWDGLGGAPQAQQQCAFYERITTHSLFYYVLYINFKFIINKELYGIN